MTTFHLFINQLTSLPLKYVQAIGCKVSADDNQHLKSMETSSDKVKDAFDAHLKSFDSNGSIRQKLIMYITENLCRWRDYRQDASAFKENKENIQTEIQSFLQTLLKLESTFNNVYVTQGDYSLQGLKPIWTTSARGQLVVQQFFQALAVIWDVPIINPDTIEQGVQDMLNEQTDSFVHSERQKELDQTKKELDQAREKISVLKSENDRLTHQLQRYPSTDPIEVVSPGPSTRSSSFLSMFSPGFLAPLELDGDYEDSYRI